MTIGIILAIEADAIFDYYDNPVEIATNTNYKLYYLKKNNSDIYILQTGMGEIASSAGVQYLISNYHVDLIVNFGVTGGLTVTMKKQKICVVNRVVHYRYDCTEFLPLALGQVDGHDSIFLECNKDLVQKALEVRSDLLTATCCSGDRFVGNEKDKQFLHDHFEGDVCDMESAGIILTCEANHIPCLILKAVSDGLSEGAKTFFEELKDAASACLTVADQIIEQITK